MKSFILKNKKVDKTKKENRTEDITKRSIFSKTYLNDDGTKSVKISHLPYHYYDKKSKTYIENKNLFINEKSCYRKQYNRLNQFFTKQTNEHDPLLGFVAENKELKIYYRGKKENKKLKLNNVLGEVKNENTLLYQEINSSIDMEYDSTYNRVKEKIIVKNKQEDYIFNFELAINNLKLRLSENEKRIEFIDEKNRIVFYIPSPYMYDSNNAKSYDVYYEIEECDNGKLNFYLVASSDWINDKNRTFPVVIDPEVVYVVDESSSMVIFEENDTTALITSRQDTYSIAADDGIFIVFNLVDLLGWDIKEVSLSFSNTGNDNYDIDIYHYNSLISQNAQSFTIDEDVKEHFVTLQMTSLETTTLDITSLFKEWLSLGKTNGTLYFKMPENALEGLLYTPVMDITYVAYRTTPEEYLTLNNDVVYEIVTNNDVGISANLLKEGLLITYIDRDKNVLRQVYQTDLITYFRLNDGLNSWGNWNKKSLRAIYNNEILYINDEEE